MKTLFQIFGDLRSVDLSRPNGHLRWRKLNLGVCLVQVLLSCDPGHILYNFKSKKN